MNFKNRFFSQMINMVIIILLLFVSFNVRAQSRVKIAVWGDSRENSNHACEHIADILLHKITDWDFQIHTGDFSSNGSESAWQRSLGYKGMDSLFVAGKFFMCTSNHDDNRSTYDKYTAGVLPVNSADGTTHFFHHQMENVHVIFCDGYFTNTTTMNNWLDQELATISDDDWLIGVWHNPCYRNLTYKSSYLYKGQPWLQKFQAHDGDFILHGHAHVYVRTYPLLPDETVDHENGMVHIINGCGGASWKSAQTVTGQTAFTPHTSSFACITFITIEGNTAVVQTVDARPGKNLQVIDEFEWNKSTYVAPENFEKPESFKLHQNYLNPFNPTTAITYELPQSGEVEIIVYDIMGREVTTLVDEFQYAGKYRIEWDLDEEKDVVYPSGIYFCQLLLGSQVRTIKMTLMR